MTKTETKQKKQRKREERFERMDWFLTIGEVFLYVPRLLVRLFRRVFDWF